jgi:hypothetical protein
MTKEPLNKTYSCPHCTFLGSKNPYDFYICNQPGRKPHKAIVREDEYIGTMDNHRPDDSCTCGACVRFMTEAVRLKLLDKCRFDEVFCSGG